MFKKLNRLFPFHLGDGIWVIDRNIKPSLVWTTGSNEMKASLPCPSGNVLWMSFVFRGF